MSSRHKKYEDGTQKIMADHEVPFRVANDVLYLRQQPEWSQQREDEFIQTAKTTGSVPDVTKVGKTS